MNKKGQGLTEYGIILLLVVLIGGGVWASSGMSGNLKNMYSTIGTKLKSLVGGENYDTGVTFSISFNGGAQVTAEKTSLICQGSDGTYRLCWCIDPNTGYRVYFVYRDANNTHNPTDIQGTHYNLKTEPGSDGGQSTYIKCSDGNYYKITAYDHAETTITLYTGTPNPAYIRIPSKTGISNGNG